MEGTATHETSQHAKAPSSGRRLWALAAFGLVAAGAALATSCGPQGFEPASKVSTVRILAAKVTPPYAHPGDTVTVDLLVYPGPNVDRPATVSWIPLVCINPESDLYYACFPQFVPSAVSPALVVLPNDAGTVKLSDLLALPGSAGDGGAGGGGGVGFDPGALLRPGVDLSPFLPKGTHFSFRMPDDIVATHPPVPGAPAPYGLAFTFDIACTGHVEFVAPDPDAGTAVPIPFGCFDDGGVQLPPAETVLGFTRSYASELFTTKNPEITGVTFEGQPVDVDAGLDLERCRTVDWKACPTYQIDVDVPPTSQESTPTSDGGLVRERIWAAYYATAGRFGGDIRIKYDPVSGPVPNAANTYQAPQEPGEHRMWIVVRDDGNGTEWVEVPIHVK